VSELSIWIDGAARGNPGPAASAGVVKNGNTLVTEWGIPLGTRTNNEAEYLGLIFALEWLQHNPGPAIIYSDSKLLVEQVSGRWKVKAENLQLLNVEAKTLLRTLPAVKMIAVPREQNREADRMGNLALDKNEIISDDEFRPVIDEILKSIPKEYTLF